MRWTRDADEAAARPRSVIGRCRPAGVLLLCVLAMAGAAAHSASAPEAPPAAASTAAPPVLPAGGGHQAASAAAPADAVADATAQEAPAAGPHMPRWLEQGIHRWGPISVFFAFIISGVGLHLSEDLILIPAGYLAANDGTHAVRLFWEFALWAYLGVVLGDTGWFWMCRTFGTRFLHSRWFKRMMHPRRLLEIKHQIDRRGAWVLLAARFIPGTRTPVITMGGLLHMSWWSFLLVEALCVLATVPLQMAVGWFAAKAVNSAGVTDLSHHIAIGVGVTVAFVLLMYGVHVWLKSRNARRRPPRARAQWLRIYRAGKTIEPAVA